MKQHGLTEREARARLARYGRNELQPQKRPPLLLRFCKACADKMTLLLLIASAISFITDRRNGHFSPDAFIILGIVLLNATVSLIQESRAVHALAALQNIRTPFSDVVRDGVKKRIPSAEIVPGDLVCLAPGQIVPCDGTVSECNDLSIDESALTGESGGVEKSVTENAVYSGTAVLKGTGRFLATKTGMESSIGQIASLLETKQQKTPLQQRLNKLSDLFGNLTVVICVLIFLLSVWRGLPPKEMFFVGISLAVAAIPEGLPAIVTVLLSLGVQKLSGQNAIVRSLPAVETLGSATVICSDKTGTLTENRMRVVEHYGDTQALSLACLLCNDRSSPTEEALFGFGEAHTSMPNGVTRLETVPFNSESKRMITAHQTPFGYRRYIKGAPDVLRSVCTGWEKTAERWLKEKTQSGLRVIAFGCSETGENFRFLGFCALEDPPRAGVREAVAQCKQARIRTVMITGDHKDTAYSVASRLGIAETDKTVYTQEELEALPETEFASALQTCSVIARATPAFKMRVVEALQQNGDVVAMTGDGVNDAPALKKADIGCAMGKNGTEVARQSADLILTDDHFATVVSAVSLGRAVYDNIKKAIHYLLSCNIGEIVTVLLGILLSLPAPLVAIQLLWVNLVTDSLPAIALGMEAPEKDLLHRAPIPKNAPLFSGVRWLKIFTEGVMIGCLSVIAFLLGTKLGDMYVGRTMAFCVLALSQLFHAFQLRSRRSLFAENPFSNRWLTVAFLLGVGIQVAVVQIPFLCPVFSTVQLNAPQWGITFAISAFPLLYGELYKLIAHMESKRRR